MIVWPAPKRPGLIPYCDRLDREAELAPPRGATDAYGIPADDEAANLIALPFLLPPLPGCSVAFIPPKQSANGSGLLSHNCDFPIELVTRRAGPLDDGLVR